MDFRVFDRARRQVGPLQLDLVESYAKGAVSRREFIRRGTVIGLSLPLISAIISACGSDGDGGSSGTRRDQRPQGRAPRRPGPAPLEAPSRSRRRSRSASIPSPCRISGVTAWWPRCSSSSSRSGTAARSPPAWPSRGSRTRTAASGRSSSAKASSGRTARTSPRPTSPPRWIAWSRPGNSGLKGVIEKGAVDASRPEHRRVHPHRAQRQLPVPGVGVQRRRSPITPVDYETGTTLDRTPTAPAPGSWSSYNPATGATFERNDDWWGGKTPLDGTEFQFFDDLGTMVTAMQGGSVDAIVQFSVVGGDALLNSPDFNVLEVESSTHRQIWMRCDTGQFAEKGVRQALALTLRPRADARDAVQGPGRARQRPRHRPVLPVLRRLGAQRTKDIDKAKALLSDAGVTDTECHAARRSTCRRSRDLAQLIQSGAKEAGINLEIAVESGDTFYGTQWCPAEPADPPCSGAAELGIVDYGHRPVPTCSSTSALATNGVWNSSQYTSAEFDAAFKEYQGAIGVDAQKAAMQEDRDDPQRRRAGRHAVLLQLPGWQLEEVPGRAGVRRSGRCSSRRPLRSDHARSGGARCTSCLSLRPQAGRVDVDSLRAPADRAVDRHALAVRARSCSSSSTCCPGDVGRQIAGPFAPQETVDALNERLGADDPLPVQYGRLVRSSVTFDFGDSFQFSRPVGDLLWPALLRSAKLVALGLFLTIPISIMAGVFAARRRNTLADRSVVTVGLASSSIPEFVSGVTLPVPDRRQARLAARPGGGARWVGPADPAAVPVASRSRHRGRSTSATSPG